MLFLVGRSVQKTSDDEVTNDLRAGLLVGSLSQVNYESGKFVQLSYWNITNNITTAQQLQQTASHSGILVRKIVYEKVLDNSLIDSAILSIFRWERQMKESPNFPP